MARRYFYALGGVLPHHLSSEMKDLYWASQLQSLALAMLLLFEPIYLWQQGLSLRSIVLYFLGVYIAYFLTMPLGANFATHFGYEHSMAISTIVQIAYYFSLFAVVYSWWYLVLAAALYALQKAFYWPAYHADFVRYSDQTEEGKEISGLSVASSLVYIIGPLLAGFILQYSSWLWLFIAGSLVLLLSNWPLLRTKRVFTPRVFPYSGAYQRLVEPGERRRLFGYMGFGEELIVLVLWPVFISIVVVGYLEIGLVVAISTLVMSLIVLYVGKLTDEHNKHSVLRFSTILYALGWLVRLVIISPFQVFLVDLWSRFTKNIVSVPLTAITYERAKTRSVMDTVVLFEMSLVVGKIIAAIILLIVFSLTSSITFAWQAAWLLAAIMTFLYVLV